MSRPRPRRSPRRRPLAAIALSGAFAVAALPALAAPPPAGRLQIEARVPAAMPIGEPARLEVLLLDEDRRLVPAPRELRVVVHGAGALIDGEEFEFPAGAEAIAIELRPQKAGVWAVEVVAEGLEPLWVPCAAVPAETAAAMARDQESWLLVSAREAPRSVREHQPWPRPDTPVGARAVPPRPVPVRPVGFSIEGRETQLRRLARRVPAAEGADAIEALERAVAVQPELEEVVEQIEAAEPAERIGRREILARALEAENRAALMHPGPLLAAPAAEGGVAPAPAEPGSAPPPPPPPPPPDRGLRLIPGEAAVGPGPDGRYRLQVFGYWYEGDEPALRAEPLDFDLVADPLLPELSIEPAELELPAGGMRASTVVVGRRRGEVVLRALYPGGESTPTRLTFVAARPDGLELTELPPRLRTLSVGELEVTVRLLDTSGRPTVAAEDLEVTVSAVSEAGTRSKTVTVPAGQGEARAEIELARFGEHRLSARAAGLASEPVTMAVAFDLQALLFAFAGGLLGGLVPLLRAKRRKRGVGLLRVVRALVLAVLAAGLVVMLAAFGLLGELSGNDPTGLWAALAGLPLANQAAVFVIGFLAGFAGDWIFERLRGALSGERRRE